MMYNNKLVVVVKAAGKVLRELKDTVFIPFGSEYTLLIKNLDTVRAQVRVTIDGTDATEGVSLIVPANGEIELERFIKNGNMKAGNKFKFIERTTAIEEHKGIGVTDGLIRIEFQFEKRIPAYVPPIIQHHHYHQPHGYWLSRGLIGQAYNSSEVYCSAASAVSPDPHLLKQMTHDSNVLRSKAAASASSTSIGGMTNTAYMASAQNMAAPVNDVGITVAGSKSEQEFTIGAQFAVEPEVHVLVIKVLGETEPGKPVVQAVTVKAKPKCSTCGRTNKAGSKFCTECGTSLNII